MATIPSVAGVVRLLLYIHVRISTHRFLYTATCTRTYIFLSTFVYNTRSGFSFLAPSRVMFEFDAGFCNFMLLASYFVPSDRTRCRMWYWCSTAAECSRVLCPVSCAVYIHLEYLQQVIVPHIPTSGIFVMPGWRHHSLRYLVFCSCTYLVVFQPHHRECPRTPLS